MRLFTCECNHPVPYTHTSEDSPSCSVLMLTSGRVWSAAGQEVSATGQEVKVSRLVWGAGLIPSDTSILPCWAPAWCSPSVEAGLCWLTLWCHSNPAVGHSREDTRRRQTRPYKGVHELVCVSEFVCVSECVCVCVHKRCGVLLWSGSWPCVCVCVSRRTDMNYLWRALLNVSYEPTLITAWIRLQAYVCTCI